MTEANKRVWYCYSGKKQTGPFTDAELKKSIASGSITARDYVFKQGMKDWAKLSDVPELAVGRSPKPQHGTQTVARVNSGRQETRAPLRESSIAHNSKQVATAVLSNISQSGVLLETPTSVFALGDPVRITVKAGHSIGGPINLQGVVVRKSPARAGKVGYGIRLADLDESARVQIVDYIKTAQA